MIKQALSKPLLTELRIGAKIQLRKSKPLIIGVGGASGKSSLVALISSVLKEKKEVRFTKGKNSQTGIPLDILGIEPGNYSYMDWLRISLTTPARVISDWQKTDIYIVEMGIDGPKEPQNMSYLLKFVRPDIAVLTNIEYEHSENFDPHIPEKDGPEREEKILDLTAEQQGLLFKSVKKSGTVIINLDDQKIKGIKDVRARKLTVSDKDKKADFFIKKVQSTKNSFTLSFLFNKKEYLVRLKNPLPKYYAHSIALAVAVLHAAGVSVSDSIKAIEKEFRLPPGRAGIFKGIKNTTIIDSSYNSSLSALRGLLDLLVEISGKNRKVFIGGDLRELGSMSKKIHQLVAEEIINKTDFAILVGPAMKEYVSPILQKSGFNHLTFPDFSLLKGKLVSLVKAKDTILVKGSQNNLFLERAVELLLKDLRDRSRLCRRGEFWDKKRKESK